MRSTVTKLPSPLPLEADDRELLRRVTGFYAQTLKESPAALSYLNAVASREAEALERFRLGYANRTLCYRLPEKTSGRGALARAPAAPRRAQAVRARAPSGSLMSRCAT